MFYYTIKKKKRVDGHIKISDFELKVVAFQVCFATQSGSGSQLVH